MKRKILLFVETSREFGRGIIEGVSRYALEQDSWSIHFQDRGLSDRIPGWLKRWQGDGIIARTADRETEAILREKKVPVVELLGNGDSIRADILCDNHIIGVLAAEHFRERGFRNFAYYSPEAWYWSEQRRTAFVNEIKSFESECFVFPLRKQRHVSYFLPYGRIPELQLLVEWLSGLPKPIGLFAVSDINALFVLEACKEAGLNVPEEVAILGVDNDSLLCRIGHPQLSSIDPNTKRMGYEAARLMESLLKGNPRPTEPMLIPSPGIITRQTTDIIAVNDQQISLILKYMREHYRQIISINQLAKTFDVTRRTLERRFRSLLYRTPEEELIRLKLDRAKTLLRDSDLSVSQIGQISGFSSPEYFSRIFHQKCKLSPREFRKQLQ